MSIINPMVRFAFISLTLFLLLTSFWRNWPQSAQQDATHQKELQTCVVLKIYDGDTLACDLNGDGKIRGQAEHIRLLGIDASEMHYSPKNKTGKDEPYALEAKTYLEKMLLHKKAYLELDQKQFDKYNRTLAYAYRDPEGEHMINTELLSSGLAKVRIIGENRRYERLFLTLESEARKNNQNLWPETQK